MAFQNLKLASLPRTRSAPSTVITLWPYDVSLDGLDDLVDAFPVICVFSLPVDDLEALEYVDDVVDASALDGQLARALVQVQQALALAPVQTQEPSAQLTQALLLPAVRKLRLQRAARVSLFDVLSGYRLWG